MKTVTDLNLKCAYHDCKVHGNVAVGCKMSENVIKTNVVIVGAGIAGLSSASLFVKNHFSDFMILEARDRIGGRILSFDGPNRKLELGANWIHGVLGSYNFITT